MKDDGGIAYLTGADAQVVETDTQLAVFCAIAHLLVEAIHGQQVVAPTGGITPIPCGPGRSHVVHEAGESLALGQLQPLLAPLHAHLLEPSG